MESHRFRVVRFELVEACDDAVTSIGGNIGAPPTSPDTHGFLSPEAVSISGDRPYAAQIPISGTTDRMSDVDYYEFQWSDDDGVTWNDMPIGAAGAVVRGYIEFPSLTFGYPLFSAVPTPAPPPPGFISGE